MTTAHARFGLDKLRRAALGFEPGISANVKFGNNTDIDTGSVPEDVWGGGGVYTGFPTGSAETLDVSSSDANDTAAGTGARTIRLYGLDADYAEITEDVTLLGATLVTTTQEFLRCSRIKVLTAGTGAENAGTITIHHTTTTANVFAIVPAGSNQSRVAALTVPADKAMLILSLSLQLTRASGAAGSATVSLRTRELGSVFRSSLTAEPSTGAPLLMTFETGLRCEPKTDIKWHVEAVSDNNSIVAGQIEYILVDV